MTPRPRGLAALLVVAAGLAQPSSAAAHAALLRTLPAASGVVTPAPSEVVLTYSEVVAPRFAIVSVTDAGGHQVTVGPPRREASDATSLAVPLRALTAGYYLVYWRVISADGHPVRGAFTFAVGPNAGPPPQFVIPSIAETAATPALVGTRFAAILLVMLALGLVAFRLLIARPVAPLSAASLRAVDVAAAVTTVAALVAVPVFLVTATAQFALRPTLDLATIVPLVRASGFGRGYVDLEAVLALFLFAAVVAVRTDVPTRARRSVVDLLAVTATVLAGACALTIPGLSGHPAQTSPAALLLAIDFVHLAAGTVWLGGLVGLLVLAAALPAGGRVAGLALVVPRFSRVALAAVIVLVGSGTTAAIVHLPTLAALWHTSYGLAIVAKVVLLALALPLAAINRSRVRRPATAERVDARRRLRRLVSGEALLATGAVLIAAILTSLPPPARALGRVGAASAHVGPGAVPSEVVVRDGYRLAFRIDPNRAGVPNAFAVAVSRGGRPVRGAEVTVRFDMLDMDMSEIAYALPERQPGVYTRSAPALVMVGHWALRFEVVPPGHAPIEAVILDKADG